MLPLYRTGVLNQAIWRGLTRRLPEKYLDLCYRITGQTVISCYPTDQRRRAYRGAAAGERSAGMEAAVTQFLTFLAVEKGASQNTVAAYRNDLQQFAAFCAGGKTNGSRPAWTQIDRSRIQDYLRSLQARGYADATIARKVAAIKSFFGFMHAEGLIPVDPTE